MKELYNFNLVIKRVYDGAKALVMLTMLQLALTSPSFAQLKCTTFLSPKIFPDIYTLPYKVTGPLAFYTNTDREVSENAALKNRMVTVQLSKRKKWVESDRRNQGATYTYEELAARTVPEFKPILEVNQITYKTPIFPLMRENGDLVDGPEKLRSSDMYRAG